MGNSLLNKVNKIEQSIESAVFSSKQDKRSETSRSKILEESLNRSKMRYKKKLKSSHAFIGEKVMFTRKDLLVIGLVIDYRTESVIVEISEEDAHKLNLVTCLTVVNHKNYRAL